MNIQTTTVKATSRKLKAKWTPELAEDVKAYQSVPGAENVTGVPDDAVEISPFIKGKLYQINHEYTGHHGPLMFLGLRETGEHFCHEFYFLAGEKIMCFYYYEFEKAAEDFELLYRKPQK